jgi:hypothetical protein
MASDVEQKAYRLAVLVHGLTDQRERDEALALVFHLQRQALREGDPHQSGNIEVQMDLQTWRAALTGLCVGPWPKDAEAAAENVRRRLKAVGETKHGPPEPPKETAPGRTPGSLF